MRTETTSRRPLTFAVTVPPPAIPSTSTWPSDSNALSNASRSLPAFPIRSASIPSLLNTVICFARRKFRPRGGELARASCVSSSIVECPERRSQ